MEVEEQIVPEASKTGIDKKWKIALFLFGFLLYANTVKYDYTLDDKIVVTSNQITKKGFDGILGHFSHDLMDGFWAEQYGIPVDELKKSSLVAGGRYRPLSVVSYAIEWELFGENPGLSHLINAILYGFIGLVFFLLLQKLFPPSDEPVWRSISFWVTLLFLAHPLHVEVVASIKGRDEIFNLLFGLLSLNYLVKYAETKEIKALVLAGAMLFLSLLSKETTVAFVILGPLMLYFFQKGEAKEWKTSLMWMVAAGVLYNIIRYAIVGSPSDPIARELMNNPFLNATEGERFATIFLTLAIYAKLVILPHPLTHDYYPYHLPFLPEDDHYATWGNVGTISGIVILIALIVIVVRGVKTRSIYAYSVLFFLGTIVLVSNVLFPIGVFMNERFMFIPSVGIAIALAYFLANLKKQKNFESKSLLVYGLLGVVTLAFSVLTINRSKAWESDATLALTDVTVSLGSAKVNMAAADALLQEIPKEKNKDEKVDMINEAYTYLSRSLEIYPEYFPPLDLLGRLYFESGNYKESIKFYTYCIERKPNDTKFVENIHIIGNKLVNEGLYQEAFDAFEKALGYLPNEKRYLLSAAQVSARDLNNPSQALPYMERVYTLYPNDIEVGEKMAITYAMLGRFQEAIKILTPLYDANPNSATVVKNLGIVYYQSGDQVKGAELMNKAKELEESEN